MDKKLKYTLGIVGIVMVAATLSACNSFCSNQDVSHYLYAYDPMNMRYFDNGSQAEEYVLETFKKQTGFDTTKTLEITNIKKLNQETGAYEALTSIADCTSTYKGLTYVIPGTYKIPGFSTELDENSVSKEIGFVFGLNDFTKTIISSTVTAGTFVPSYTYFEKLDLKILDNILEHTSDYSWFSTIDKNTLTFSEMYGYTYEEYKEFRTNGTENYPDLLKSMLGTNNTFVEGVPVERTPVLGTSNKKIYGRDYALLTRLGNYKFYEKDHEDDRFYVLDKFNKELVISLGADQAMTTEYYTSYKNSINTKVINLKTCITNDTGLYGHVNDDMLDDTVLIEGKGVDFWGGWGDAFAKHGFLEGLFVYPISYMVDSFAHSFGMNGWGQIWSLLIVTVIVRLFFMLITLPSTISQQKQTALQPELAKLQQKYPNSNTNTYEKQRLAQAQMALYKKHKVHPFMTFAVLIIQFPLFIAVWNAFSGSAALATDVVLGLRLSDTIWNALTNFSGWPGNAGWWTALVLIILMSAGQIFSMLIPQWLQKARIKNVAKTAVNPTVNQQQKTMKYVQWGMIIFTIIMGFSLPSAMGVYWLAGAIFNIIQALIMHLIFNRKKKGN